MIPNCVHFSRKRDRGRGICAKGKFEGKPWLGNCLACLSGKAITIAFKKKGCSNCEPIIKTYGE